MKYALSVPILAGIMAVCAPTANSAEPQSPKRPEVQHFIDTHIHFYDPRRPGGVSWPPESDKVLYKPHLPPEYNKIAKASGVTGVVIVEASSRLPDNKWILDLVEDDNFYVGLVGNVDPYRDDFPEQIDKLAEDKRFVGVRARNPDPIDFKNPKLLKNLKYLASKNLTMDFLANGQGVEGVKIVDQLAQDVPELKIVVDHLLGWDPDGKEPPAAWKRAVRKLAKNPNVYCKVSGLYQRSAQQPAPKEVDYYRPVLDVLWKNFGKERLVYGSNWPVTKKSGDYASYVAVVTEYFNSKGQDAMEHYFWKNASEAYGLGLK